MSSRLSSSRPAARSSRRPGLHGPYASDDCTPVDVENVLAYHVGTGAIAAAARYSLVLERSFTRAGWARDAHYYGYRLAAAAPVVWVGQ